MPGDFIYGTDVMRMLVQLLIRRDSQWRDADVFGEDFLWVLLATVT